MPPAAIYRVHHLSPTHPLFSSTLAPRFSQLRLSALITSAASFSSTHAIESAFTPLQWQTRLSRPDFQTFIAVAYLPSTPDSDQTIDIGEWVGKVILRGPMNTEVYELRESGGPVLGNDEDESRWQMTALYTDPEHRRKGLGKQIINYAIEFAASYCLDENVATRFRAMNGLPNEMSATTTSRMKPKQARVRAMIHPDNGVIIKMYQDVGFMDAGLCTLTEAYVCSGDASLLPEGGGAAEKFHRRVGLVLEILKEVDHGAASNILH